MLDIKSAITHLFHRVKAGGVLLLSLAACSLFSVFPIDRAHAVTVTCGGIGGVVNVTPDPNNVNLFAIVATCGGVTFDGTSTRVDTGMPSDLLVRGNWSKTTDVGTAESQTFVFEEEDYTQPPNGPAIAWHELHGSMNLVGPVQAERLAQLSVSGTLNGMFTAGTTTGFRGGGAFDVVGPFTPVPGDPMWTRTATYVVDFSAGTGIGSVINFNNTGNNYFIAPEPASLSLLSLPLAVLAARRSRLLSGRLRRA